MSGYTYLIPDGRLAQGSVPPDHVCCIPFDVIVLAAIEHQDVPLPGYEVLYAPLTDEGPPPTAAERALIRQTAREVADRIRRGKRVLSTCHQGRNRSGVISALALVELGLPRDRAVRRIRRFRNGLTNPYFRAMVMGDNL